MAAIEKKNPDNDSVTDIPSIILILFSPSKGDCVVFATNINSHSGLRLLSGAFPSSKWRQQQRQTDRLTHSKTDENVFQYYQGKKTPTPEKKLQLWWRTSPKH